MWNYVASVNSLNLWGRVVAQEKFTLSANIRYIGVFQVERKC